MAFGFIVSMLLWFGVNGAKKNLLESHKWGVGVWVDLTLYWQSVHLHAKVLNSING